MPKNFAAMELGPHKSNLVMLVLQTRAMLSPLGRFLPTFRVNGQVAVILPGPLSSAFLPKKIFLFGFGCAWCSGGDGLCKFT